MSSGPTLVSYKLEGLRELQGQLEDLGAELAVKILARSLRKAFQPVLQSAMGNLLTHHNIESGDLLAAIHLVAVKPKSGSTVASIGLMISAKKTTSKIPPARRWHWIEFGTAHSPAHPFLRPALEANAQLVLDVLRVEIGAAIIKALKKRARAAA